MLSHRYLDGDSIVVVDSSSPYYLKRGFIQYRIDSKNHNFDQPMYSICVYDSDGKILTSIYSIAEDEIQKPTMIAKPDYLK